MTEIEHIVERRGMRKKLLLPTVIAIASLTMTVATGRTPVEAAGSGRVIGGAPLTVYAQPSTGSVAVGTLAVGTTLALECAVTNGSSVTGPYGASTLWHNVKFNNRAAWVPDAFVFTGTSGLPAGEGYCRTGRIDTLGGGAIPVWTTPTSGVALGSIANGSTVTLFCGATGASYSGRWGASTLWHMVGFGAGWGYIPDAGVYTGVNGLPSGEYWCPSTPAYLPTSTFTLSGTVTCVTQGSVMGVWLESSAGGSKYASWTRTSTTSATYSATFSFRGTSTNVTLSVGCGGTTSAWRATAKTPALSMTASTTRNVRCSPPTTGTTVSCVWQVLVPQLGLPYAVGETWTTSGTHDWNGGVAPGTVTTSTLRSSIDFSGGSGVVRAAANGTVRITSCGLVMIDHGANVWTSYYHINKDAGIVSGMSIARGTRLGTIGTGTSCGGSAAGAHVHFTVWNLPSGTSPTSVSNSSGVHLNGKCLGGWQVYDDTRNYWSRYKRLSDGAWQDSLAGYALLRNDGVVC